MDSKTIQSSGCHCGCRIMMHLHLRQEKNNNKAISLVGNSFLQNNQFSLSDPNIWLSTETVKEPNAKIWKLESNKWFDGHKRPFFLSVMSIQRAHKQAVIIEPLQCLPAVPALSWQAAWKQNHLCLLDPGRDTSAVCMSPFKGLALQQIQRLSYIVIFFHAAH